MTLTDRPDPANAEVRTTACSLDCPDGCSVAVTVVDDRIVAVDADPDGANPFTAGWICAKVGRGVPAWVHGPDRVTTPLRRVGPKGRGRFEPVGWDEALDLFAERVRSTMATAGPDAVVPYLYSSSAGLIGNGGLSPLVWEALGAAEVEHTICARTVGEAWRRLYGPMASLGPDDVDAAALVVVWGANPNVSNSHLVSVIEAARRRGAPLVVVDPRRTRVAAKADLHLAVRPGTDVVLALGVVAWAEAHGRLDGDFLAEWVHDPDAHLAHCREWTPARVAAVCRVPVADVERFADLYTSVRPALLRVGWGIERNANGGAAARAIFALPAFCGHFGVPGGGVMKSVRGLVGTDTGALRRAVLGGGAVRRRRVNMNRLGAVLVHDEGGRVEVLFVQGANPVASCPDQALVLEGLAREDLFTVVHEVSMTDTAAFADLVLPATTTYETDELVGAYGVHLVQEAPAVIPRVGGARTNDEVSTAVGIRLGLDPVTWDPDPRRVRDLLLGGRRTPWAAAGPVVQFVTTRPDGPVRLDDGRGELPTYRPVEDEALPLALITPATARTINSVFGSVAPARPVVRMSPVDAAARGLVDGDRVRVHDHRHALETTVMVTTEMSPGVVAMPKGMWRRQVDGGLTANVFAPATLDPLAGGATFNDARVDVTPSHRNS